MPFTLKLGIMLGSLLIIGYNRVYAQIKPIPESIAVNCVIGEAENQGEKGMLAVAYALRNRGTTKGVYGCRASRVVNKKYSEKTYSLALKAWRESSSGQDMTFGANMWENVKEFGKPYWADSLRKTVLIGDHQFYKK